MSAESGAKRGRADDEVGGEAESNKKARTDDGTAEAAESGDYVLVDAKDVPTPAEADKAAAAQNDAPKRFPGECKWFDQKKGFGFVIKDGTKEEIFCHMSACSTNAGFKGLEKEEKVEFEVILDDQGRDRATNITAPGGGPCKGMPDIELGMGMPMAMPTPVPAVPAELPKHTDTPLAPGRYRGSCKWFNATKGFGFVTVQGTDEDLFVHQSELSVVKGGFRSLANEENVEFEIAEDSGSKRKAVVVTGPGGAHVIGQPKEAPSARAMQGAPQGYPPYGAYPPQGYPPYGAPAGGYPYYGHPQGGQAYPAYGHDAAATYGGAYGSGGGYGSGAYYDGR